MSVENQAISTVDMNRESWLETRRMGICGTDVAAILGISPWKTPLQIWEEKKGIAPKQEETERMIMGRLIEPLVASRWVEVTGRKVQQDNKIRVHKTQPLFMANIDRLIIDNNDGLGSGVLEIKSTSSYAYKNWDTQIPLEYYCQVMHYLNVTGFTWGEFAVLVDGFHLERLPVVRDDDFISKIAEALLRWWYDHIVVGRKPPLTSDETKTLNSLQGSTISVTPDILSLYNDCVALKKQLNDVEEKYDSCADRLKEFMQGIETLIMGDKILATYKSSAGLNIEKLRMDKPELYKKYVTKFDTTAFKEDEKVLHKLYSDKSIGSRKFLLKGVKDDG